MNPEIIEKDKGLRMKLMKQANIKNEYPPNFNQIKAIAVDGAIYAYDNTIYNPHSREVYEDEVIHEQVHFKQQSLYTTIDLWWMRYLIDKDFRLEQELEAYREQYKYLKNLLSSQDIKEALHELAHALSHDYNLDITYNQAESRIKKYNML